MSLHSKHMIGIKFSISKTIYQQNESLMVIWVVSLQKPVELSPLKKIFIRIFVNPFDKEHFCDVCIHNHTLALLANGCNLANTSQCSTVLLRIAEMLLECSWSQVNCTIFSHQNFIFSTQPHQLSCELGTTSFDFLFLENKLKLRNKYLQCKMNDISTF